MDNSAHTYIASILVGLHTHTHTYLMYKKKFFSKIKIYNGINIPFKHYRIYRVVSQVKEKKLSIYLACLVGWLVGLWFHEQNSQ